MTAALLDRVEGMNGNGCREKLTPFSATATRLHLGAGHVHLAGFTPIDRKAGLEAYPLPYPDSSIEEIMASHLLEHFSHREVGNVLQDWVRVLKPGGKIRIAVPDLEEICRLYQSGASVDIQGHLMGGHTDPNDRHGCAFDRESLTELMLECGLERLGLWTSNLPGCSAGPASLNMQGFKPAAPITTLENVRACLSVPRFGPLLHPRCAERAFMQLRIPTKAGQSCFWHQKISSLMEEAIADPTCEFVLTLDFDTVFSAHDVMELYRLLRVCPEVDAVFPLQSKRCCQEVLFSLTDASGKFRSTIDSSDLARNLLPANTGHFGLTMFRADSLRRFPRPWMNSEPSKEGLWEPGQTDADIVFWRRFKAAGFKACLAPRVVVGHMEEAVKWPGKDLKPVYQHSGDYEESGIPAEVIR